MKLLNHHNIVVKSILMTISFNKTYVFQCFTCSRMFAFQFYITMVNIDRGLIKELNEQENIILSACIIDERH